MGWQDCHLHEFRVKDVNGKLLSFGFPDEEFDMEILPCWEYKITKFMSLVRPTFEYIYDFGDNWRH